MINETNQNQWDRKIKRLYLAGLVCLSIGSILHFNAESSLRKSLDAERKLNTALQALDKNQLDLQGACYALGVADAIQVSNEHEESLTVLELVPLCAQRELTNTASAVDLVGSNVFQHVVEHYSKYSKRSKRYSDGYSTNMP